MTGQGGGEDVFINCPFDQDYLPMFRAMIFTIVRCGFFPRCAQERDDASEIRFTKLVELIADCRLSIHDISCTALDHQGLPRFNMPFELGMMLGAKHIAKGDHAAKQCLILEGGKYSSGKYLSDLAGVDPKAHNNDVDTAIAAIRDFLNGQIGPEPLTATAEIQENYALFSKHLPEICKKSRHDEPRLSYEDYHHFVANWIVRNC